MASEISRARVATIIFCVSGVKSAKMRDPAVTRSAPGGASASPVCVESAAFPLSVEGAGTSRKDGVLRTRTSLCCSKAASGASKEAVNFLIPYLP